MKLRRRACASGEVAYRWKHQDDAMASGKLARSIRDFTQDQVKLDSLLAGKLA